MVSSRMTSTPSRRIVTSEAANAGPNVPAGSAALRSRAASTSACKPASVAASGFPFRPVPTSPRMVLNRTSSGRTSCGIRAAMNRSSGSNSPQ